MNDPKNVGKMFSNFSLSFLNLGTTTSEQHLSLAASGFQKQTNKQKKKRKKTQQNRIPSTSCATQNVIFKC